MKGDMLALLLVLSPVLSLPQLPAEEDPWLAVINGNNKPSQVNEDNSQDSEYYQFEDTQQPQQPQQPQQRYPGPPLAAPDRRVDAGQPQQGYPQPPPQKRLPPPPRGQFRGGQPIQRRPLPPPPPPRPQPQKEDVGIIGNIVKGVSDVFQPATCAATNLIAEEKLKDETFIRSQLDCAMGRAPCDEIGRQIKILAPEVLAGRCPAPCNPCIKNQIRKVMSQLSQTYPREFNQMMQQFRRG